MSLQSQYPVFLSKTDPDKKTAITDITHQQRTCDKQLMLQNHHAPSQKTNTF